MTEYLRANIAQNGLLLSNFLQLFLEDATLKKEWSLVAWKCTRDWLILIINTAKRLADALLIKIQIAEGALKTDILITAYKTKLAVINNDISEPKEYLMKQKITKLQKDIKKFDKEKVYPYLKENYIPMGGDVSSDESQTSCRRNVSNCNSSNDIWGSNGTRLDLRPSFFGYERPPFQGPAFWQYPMFPQGPQQFFPHSSTPPFLDRGWSEEEGAEEEITNGYSGKIRHNNPCRPGARQGREQIVNLSDRALTETETRVLKKGLGFVPTPQQDKFQDTCELQFLFHMIRLKEFFQDKPEQTQADTGLRNPSRFTPNAGQFPSEILTFEQAVLKEVSRGTTTTATFLPQKPQR